MFCIPSTVHWMSRRYGRHSYRSSSTTVVGAPPSSPCSTPIRTVSHSNAIIFRCRSMTLPTTKPLLPRRDTAGLSSVHPSWMPRSRVRFGLFGRASAAHSSMPRSSISEIAVRDDELGHRQSYASASPVEPHRVQDECVRTTHENRIHRPRHHGKAHGQEPARGWAPRGGQFL